jgi:pyruvate kinase
MMARIAIAAETSGRHGDRSTLVRWDVHHEPDMATALSSAASAIVRILPVSGIVAFTQSGHTAQLVSRQRPVVPIYAFTPDDEVYRRLCLVWGVTPMKVDYVEHLEELSQRVSEGLLTSGLAQPGELIVMTGGHPLSARGATNFVKVIRLA